MQSRLKGLPGVRVAVAVKDGHGTAKDAGFDCRTYRTDVESQLCIAGIKVLEIGDRATPLFCLNINLGDQYYEASLKVVPGDLQSQLGSTVPKWPRRGRQGPGTVADALNDAKKLIDEFVDDWLAVNGTA